MENEIPVPGEQQEGLAIDGSGAVWIADDKDKSVLRMSAGLAGLEKHLQGAASPSPEGEGGPAGFLKPKNPLKQ